MLRDHLTHPAQVGLGDHDRGERGGGIFPAGIYFLDDASKVALEYAGRLRDDPATSGSTAM